jgi:hypothetical protein
MLSRTHVATACVHSRCLYLSGTLPSFAAPAMSRLAASFYRPLRALAGVRKTVLEGAHSCSNAAVCMHLGVAPMEWMLAASRLRFAAKAARSALRFAVGLYKAPAATVGGRPRWLIVLPFSCWSTTSWANSLHQACILKPGRCSGLPFPDHGLPS